MVAPARHSRNRNRGRRIEEDESRIENRAEEKFGTESRGLIGLRAPQGMPALYPRHCGRGSADRIRKG